MTIFGPYIASLVTVHDGDTFTAKVTKEAFDFGFHVFITGEATQKFRLNRCNAAPLHTPSGDGAQAALLGLLSSGDTFSLLSVAPYKYGDEWMAEVTLPDGSNVSDTMILKQWAAPWTGQGAQPLPPWPRTVT